MTLVFSPPLISLVRFAQIVAEFFGLALIRRLGLGLTGRLGVLPRAEHRRALRELAVIEGLTRRAIFAMAAMQGPLPAPPPRPRPATLRRAAAAASTEAAPRAPMFRLTEAVPAPGRNRARTAPSVSKLTSGGPALETDLLPAGRIARRLVALEAVFRDVHPHIQRMRRLIGAGARSILSRVTGMRPEQAPVLTQHRLLADIDDLADSLARGLDSS
ncbi:MAG: hypothetical protein ACK4MQ_09400 [Hyphomonas sp.]